MNARKAKNVCQKGTYFSRGMSSGAMLGTKGFQG